MLHLILAALVIVIAANVAVVVLIASTVMRSRKSWKLLSPRRTAH
jgi:hypothetical protein